MYLIPEVQLIVHGEQINIDSHMGPISGRMEIVKNRYCIVLCRKYRFEGANEDELVCVCSCMHKEGES